MQLSQLMEKMREQFLALPKLNSLKCHLNVFYCRNLNADISSRLKQAGVLYNLYTTYFILFLAFKT